MNFKNLSYLLIFSLFLSLFSCKEEVNIKIPDVSHIRPEFQLIRFDQKLMSADTNAIQESINDLMDDYPAFSELYFKQILLQEEEGLAEGILGFINDERIVKLYDTTQVVMGSLKEIEDDFFKAFQLFQYYFPESDVPNIYCFISEYAYQNFIFDDVAKDGLGVGLDMFLGADYPYRLFNPNNASFSAYLTRSFNKDHMVKKTLETLLQDKMGNTEGNTLLDNMIHNGKKLYIIDKLIPMSHDSIVMEYSEEQLEWCRNNELQMWGYFFDENLFYTNDLRKINKLINPSPNSQGMPPAAPGRTANYMGWQIVESFMKRNQGFSLDQLIKEKNAQKILELAKYKPRRN